MDNIDLYIYEKDISIDDLYLIYMKNKDFIGHIKDIDEINKKITLYSDINKDTLILDINDDNNILLKTSKYTISDIEKLIEFDEDEFDDITEIILKQDVYPELEIETEEQTKSKYEYTKEEKSEILLSNLIIAYDNNSPLFLRELSDNINDLLSISDIDEIYNYKIKDIKNKNELPNWIIPIFDIKPKFYMDDMVYEDIIEIDKLTVDADYKKYMNIIMNDKYEAVVSDTNSTGYNIEYSGRYLTDCLIDGCITNDTLYYIDERRTRDEINIPIKIDKKMDRLNIIPKQNMNLKSLMILPIRLSNFYYNIDADSRIIPLHEKIKYSIIKYSNKSFSKYINDNYFKLNFKNLDNEQIDMDDINIYDITNKRYNSELIIKDMDNLPSVKELLETINIPIYNYSDVEKILSVYNVLINDLTVTDIKYINNRMRLSIKDIKKYTTEYVPIKYEKVKLDIEDRIGLIKEYIFKQTDINIRNYYLNQFIERYTRFHKDDNWLYSIHNKEKILCKHHVLSSKISYDKDIFQSLISIYGTEPIDGIIYCKNCGEYISEENFAITEEFKDDGIIKKDIIVNEDLDILEALTDTQIIITERIKLFSRSLGVELNEPDIYEILLNYELLKNEDLANKRYNKELVSTTNHPIIREAIDKNLNNTKLKKVKLNVRAYLIYTNQLIYLYIVILIYIQTSIPEYSVDKKSLELIDFSNKSYERLNVSDDDSSINMTMINYLISIIRQMTKNYGFEDFWKYSESFLKEYDNIKTTKPEIQIINCIKYIISPYYSKILDRINKYTNHKDTSGIGYIKKYWTTYKPNPNNNDILKINKIIQDNKKDNDYLLRNNISGYNIENITDITPINRIEYKYKQYNINNFTILNRSFKTLYKFIISLYGNYDNIKYILLLINSFKNRLTDKKTEILTILKKYKLDKLELNRKVSFMSLKKMIYEINKLYLKKENNIMIMYDHIIFNSPEYNYIITNPIRHYTYNSINLYSDDIITNDMKKLLQKKYCYDKYGNIIYNDSHNYTRKYISLDINIQLSNFKKNIETDNIYKSINEIHKHNKLELLSQKINRIIVERRLINFINKNEYEKHQNMIFEKLIETTNELLEDKKQNYDELYKREFSNIIKSTNIIIKKIIDFINKNPLLNKYLKNIKLEKIFNSIVESDDLVFKDNIIRNTNMRIKLISENISQEKTNIPKYWMNNQYNSDMMKDFIMNKRNTTHDDVFMKSSNKTFDKYFDKSDYFKNLHTYTKNIIKDIKSLIGDDNTLFTKKYGVYLQRYVFVYYFDSIITYIQNISSLNNDMPNMDNILYELLENNNKDNITESIDTLSSFLIDIVTNMIQEYTDPQWINNKSSLSERLGIQKEREKQSLVQIFDMMTPEERELDRQKQKFGISNWYQVVANENQEYINSDEYKNATDQERIEFINNIQQSNSPEIDALNENGIDINFQKPIKQSNADYDEYSYNDGDVTGDSDLDGFDRNTIDD